MLNGHLRDEGIPLTKTPPPDSCPTFSFGHLARLQVGSKGACPHI